MHGICPSLCIGLWSAFWGLRWILPCAERYFEFRLCFWYGVTESWRFVFPSGRFLPGRGANLGLLRASAEAC